jgi:hypothetical protein
MSDDIVTRLRDEKWVWVSELALREDAADEIERLRAIIQEIANAVTDEGRKPGYHQQQVNYVRTMWFPLWKAIGKAVKETKND